VSEKFGKYLLLKQIAVGGMGEIFLAQERGFGGVERTLVVKRLLPSLTSSEEFVDMFLDEGRIAAQLSHPNIVQLYEVGQNEGRYYIAMEYVDGLSLAELLIRMAHTSTAALPLDVALPVAHGLAAALSYAHGRKDSRGDSLAVVHRDVTPQNVLLSRLGGVKLTDFGIATAANKVHVTTVGKVKGKLAYMAPEQARGEKVDARADLFALGILMYEMTTGVHPFLDAARFAGDSPDAVQALIKIITSPPAPPSAQDPLYPNDLQALVLRCLEKDPDDRLPSAEAVERKLEELMEIRQIAPSGRALADLIARVCPATNRPATMTGPVVVLRPGQGTVPMGDAAPAAAGTVPADLYTQAGPVVRAPEAMEIEILEEDGPTLDTRVVDDRSASAWRALAEDEPARTEATSPYDRLRRSAQLRVILYAFGAAMLGAVLTLVAIYVPSWDAPTPTGTPLQVDDPPRLLGRDAATVALGEEALTGPLLGPSAPEVPGVDPVGPDGGVSPSGPTMDFTTPETPSPPSAPTPRRPGVITFRVYPWAYVSVDGQAHGQAPLPPVAASAGPHRVTLRCGTESKTFVVRVPPGGRAPVSHRFSRCR
jgi:serine/threonine-protein kinase